MQLHSRSGFVFYNNFNSGIYYQTSGQERFFSQSYHNIALGGEAFIESSTSLSLAEIGQLFKMDYLAVSQAAKKFEQKGKVNHKIGEIKRKMITTLREN